LACDGALREFNIDLISNDSVQAAKEQSPANSERDTKEIFNMSFNTPKIIQDGNSTNFEVRSNGKFNVCE